MKLHARDYESPIGKMLLLGTAENLSGVYFYGQRYFPTSSDEWDWNPDGMCETVVALEQYFDGQGDGIQVPSLAINGTSFQKRVWAELSRIPSGQTRSYGEIARLIGAEAAVRAVGAAIGRNPVSVLVPCHRVVSSSGKLTGYAGGLERKEWLLNHEKLPS